MRRLLLTLTLVASATPLAAQAPTPQVVVAKPLQKTIAEWDEYTGRFDPFAIVEVRSRVSGFIDQIHFRDGQIVQKGELLFSIDRRPFEIAVESARADIARAQAQLEQAQNDIERAQPLLQNKTLTQREFDTRLSVQRVALAALQTAQASLKNAELNLEWTEVSAPISGRVSDRRVDVGNLVAGGQGASATTLLTTIVAPDPIYFSFDASEADYLKYSRLYLNGKRPTGRDSPIPVEVRLADEKSWSRRGQMDFVDNVLNPRSGTIRGRAIFENKDGFLTPGVFGRMRLWAGDVDALLIPDTAIQSDQANKIVLVVLDDGMVAPRVLTLGPLSSGLRVVTSGLKAEERVIINGQANPFVRPGAKVVAQPGEIKERASN